MSDVRQPKRFGIWFRRGLWVVAGVFFLALVNGIYHTNKALPDGLSFEGAGHKAQDVHFLRDLTYLDQNGERQVEQEIFDAVFEMIRGAEEFILVDMFLFNDFQGAKPETTRRLCRELTDELIARKSAVPDIEIHVITDPINTVYGGMESPHLKRLAEAGVHVTLTDLSKLRDSNPLYSSFWRLLVKPFGNSEGSLVPNPFGEGRVSLRSYFSLLNFKANHRKVIVTDGVDELTGLVTSANPHDGSSAHGNVALQFSGDAAVDLLSAEEAVLGFSGGTAIAFDYQAYRGRPSADKVFDPSNSALKIKIVSESRIQREAIRLIREANEIDLVMFYLADREIVAALHEAADGGTRIRLILDPNKDAFGHRKGGVPNRQVAGELTKHETIEIRWAATNGEQCHSKMLLARSAEGNVGLLLGSANFTRRNIDDFNLELNVLVSGDALDSTLLQAGEYFDTIWQNDGGRLFTTDFKAYEDDSSLKVLRYRVMELTGLSTF